MKKLIIAITVIAFISCKKESTNQPAKPLYIKIQAVNQDNSITESSVILVR